MIGFLRPMIGHGEERHDGLTIDEAGLPIVRRWG